MAFKPNEFFIGLVDFITILLPGALLSAILLLVEVHKPIAGSPLYLYALDEKMGTIFWVAFVFASFGIGHFVSSIASGLDPIYDKIRKKIHPYHEDIIAKINKPQGEEISLEELNEAWVKIQKNRWRKMLLIFFELERKIKKDNSYQHAKMLFEKEASSIQGSTNPYKWSQTILDTWYPTMAEQVNRTMAASKFFRSLVVVALLFIIFQIAGLLKALPSWMGIVLLVLSFREYIVQRHKSTQMAYRSIVTLYYAPDKLRGGKET